MTKVYDNATDIITFARGSSATYLDSDGVIKTAATDAPRIEYAEDGTLKGLLIEEQRTNLLHNTDNPPTQVANLTAGSHTLSFVGGPSTQTISDSITANAVDVFVYDTKRDSDGGAWRTGSLAQASSWYNETLNTSTRGSRQEFPSVAVIVAESNKVTIYDGDDPSLPMWMVANVKGQDTTNYGFTAIGGDNDLESIAAMNGKACFCGSGNYASQALLVWDFLADTFGNYSASSNYSGITSGTLADRNTIQPVTKSLPLVANKIINDVAMTVLPDAPTDPATGLPVPTIAVATNGGVSVIKDDGTVVDSSNTETAQLVDTTADGFWWVSNTFKTSNHVVFSDLTADGFGSAYGSHNSLYSFDLVTRPNNLAASNEVVLYGGSSLAGISVPGLMLHQPNYTTQAEGMSALTTSTYNTGWMPGDIKLAALANSATADRSVNNKQLTQYGTITAAPVATGADVVAYSGFSSSNYLEQPYNSDLDFGTGDFCVMGWVKPSTAGDEYVFDCRDASNTAGFGCYRNGSTGNFVFITQSGGNGSNVTGTSSNLTSIWTHLVVSRTGDVLQVYVNGVLETSSSLTLRDVDSTSRYLVVGNSYGHFTYHAWEGSLALLRISATAPTADQIAKIYEDEKLLFQPNAKATLDGTSDAVTALAHDPETDLLHVGTNQSRSVFYGLRRINQTGTPVTTAISAVDGLISEQ